MSQQPREIHMIEANSALLLGSAIASRWVGILNDIFVVVVLVAMLLVLTAPFWTLGLIFWSWWRAGAFDYSGHSPIHGQVQRFMQNVFGRGGGQHTKRGLRFFSHGSEEREK
jgi:hypothetical protein